MIVITLVRKGVRVIIVKAILRVIFMVIKMAMIHYYDDISRFRKRKVETLIIFSNVNLYNFCLKVIFPVFKMCFITSKCN